MEELAGETGVTVAGGDVVRGRCWSLTVAVTGWADTRGRARRPRRRAPGRPGRRDRRAGRVGGGPAAARRAATPAARPLVASATSGPGRCCRAGRALARAGVTRDDRRERRHRHRRAPPRGAQRRRARGPARARAVRRGRHRRARRDRRRRLRAAVHASRRSGARRPRRPRRSPGSARSPAAHGLVLVGAGGPVAGLAASSTP